MLYNKIAFEKRSITLNANYKTKGLSMNYASSY